MLEPLIPIAATALISVAGWFGGKGISAGLRTVKEGAEFRTSLSIGLTTIAKELAQFRTDVNTMLSEERETHKTERQEHRETFNQLEKRISIAEQFMARCDQRLTHIETTAACQVGQNKQQ